MVEHPARFHPSPGVEYCGSLGELYHAAAAAKCMVGVETTGKAAVPKGDSVLEHDIVVVVVMSAEHALDVPAVEEGGKKTRVDGGAALVLNPPAHILVPGVVPGFTVFQEGNMEEGQGRVGNPSVFNGESPAVAHIPLDLFWLDPIVLPIVAREVMVAVRIEKIEDSAFLSGIRGRIDGNDLVCGAGQF